MPLASWHPPTKRLPSDTYRGEATKEPLHLAVGRALNQWECLESALAEIFRLMVDSRSMAAARAYGTISSAIGRRDALKAAASEFFRNKSDPCTDDFGKLFKAHESAAKYRNNIAHGICYGIVDVGKGPIYWFLCPPQYNTKKNERLNSNRIFQGSDYVYKASDILNCENRFEELCEEPNRLGVYLRTTYSS
jgi:hypothetical protein